MVLVRVVLCLLALCAMSVGLNGQEPPPPAPSPSPSQTESLPAPTPDFYAPAPLPSSQEMTSSYESAFVRMIVTLLGLVVLIVGTFWVLRRLGRGKLNFGAGKSIQILEKRPLSPKSMLYLISVGDKQILVAESQLEVRLLTPVEEEPADDQRC